MKMLDFENIKEIYDIVKDRCTDFEAEVFKLKKAIQRL